VVDDSLSYQSAGVNSEQLDSVMPRLVQWVERSFALRPGHGKVKLPLGYFANVIDLGHGVGLALSTDGVGTKLLVAQMLGKYDTVGIDCVAMNVNDVLCVGAEPLAILDYIAIEAPHADLLEQIAQGLYRGAELAGVTIPGGEIAQIAEMVHGTRRGYAFDLVGSCVGQVAMDRILVGQDIEDGDVVLGLRSSGIHSNGLTLARRVFFDRLGWAADHYVAELGRTIGEELLEPTRIYVKEALALLNAGLRVKGFFHITSTGFLNLCRVDSQVGYVLDRVPEPPPIFPLIQEAGKVSEEEMFFTYNMGIGFCVVVHPDDAAPALEIVRRHGTESHAIGHAVSDPQKRVRIPARGLTGRDDKFYRV
jgi:phosphoribosylformylglycinamidine cyclo-ligase